MSAGVFNQIVPGDSSEQELFNSSFLSYNFDVIDGVSYRIDVTQARRYDNGGNLVNPHSHRIVDLEFAGHAVDAEQVFIVATNNYRAYGGGNFPGMDESNVVIVAPDTNRDVLANYILEERTIDPSADGNWSFAPIPFDVEVVFTTSPKADQALPPGSPIRKIGMTEDGFGRYRIRF